HADHDGCNHDKESHHAEILAHESNLLLGGSRALGGVPDDTSPHDGTRWRRTPRRTYIGSILGNITT
ncbi:MAG TPA: hypothetical protein VE338_18900, partial [Ktedonobacterales bacterium]|nr:hypothetical protein [Ktedonobacterales bacterium]